MRAMTAAACAEPVVVATVVQPMLGRQQHHQLAARSVAGRGRVPAASRAQWRQRRRLRWLLAPAHFPSQRLCLELLLKAQGLHTAGLTASKLVELPLTRLALTANLTRASLAAACQHAGPQLRELALTEVTSKSKESQAEVHYDNHALAALVAALPALSCLNLHTLPGIISDAGVLQLSSLRHLAQLSLTNCPNVSAAGRLGAQGVVW